MQPQQQYHQQVQNQNVQQIIPPYSKPTADKHGPQTSKISQLYQKRSNFGAQNQRDQVSPARHISPQRHISPPRHAAEQEHRSPQRQQRNGYAPQPSNILGSNVPGMRKPQQFKKFAVQPDKKQCEKATTNPEESGLHQHVWHS